MMAQLKRLTGFLAVASLLVTAMASTSALAVTKDWPTACYNEVSMWVTQACKEYIETVYYPSLTTTTDTTTTTADAPVVQEPATYLAGPGPVFGAGAAGLVLVFVSYRLLLRRRRLQHPDHG